MPHRIVVLGAGYAGATAAGYLARNLDSDDFEITLVNAEPDFVERMRLHQLAAGRELRRLPLTDMFAGTGVRLRVASVTAIDPRARTITVADGEGADQLEYDTVLYTLGSTADRGVPGVEEYAFHLASRPAAQRLRQRVEELSENATVLVVGGNLTGIEVATELAEARPDVRVSLATSDEPGEWLGPVARRHLRRAFDRFGITVYEHTTVGSVESNGVVATDGTSLPADVTVWAAGFAVSPIAADGGLQVEDTGRLVVDRSMRSVSHPRVYGAGDSVLAIGDNGRPLPMSCASAGFTRMRATAAMIAELTGRKVPKTTLAYLGNCISLGQRDGVFQVVDGEARSKSWAVAGWPAVRLKRAVLRGTVWNVGHPTYGLPTRRRRLATPSGHAAERVAG